MSLLHDPLSNECEHRTMYPFLEDNHHQPQASQLEILKSNQAGDAAPLSPFWNAPQTWTVQSANDRAREVFNISGMHTESNLPPEAALVFMPQRPKFPSLLDSLGNPVYSRRYPNTILRDIPWLPNPFSLDTRGWQVTLYMVFGATVRDMAARVSPTHEPNRDQTQLENRILKKSLDYRGRHGGFGQDIRPIKGNRVTENSQKVVLGQTLKDRDAGKTPDRKPLDQFQIIFGVTWEVLPGSWKMRQSAGSVVYDLPMPQEVEPPMSEILSKLGMPIPTLAGCGLFLLNGEFLGLKSDRATQYVNIDDDPAQSRVEFHGYDVRDVYHTEESLDPFQTTLLGNGQGPIQNSSQEPVQDCFETPFEFELGHEFEDGLEDLLQSHMLDNLQNAVGDTHQSKDLHPFFQAEANFAVDSPQDNSGCANSQVTPRKEEYDNYFGYDNPQIAFGDMTSVDHFDLGVSEDFSCFATYPDGEPIFPNPQAEAEEHVKDNSRHGSTSVVTTLNGVAHVDEIQEYYQAKAQQDNHRSGACSRTTFDEPVRSPPGLECFFRNEAQFQNCSEPQQYPHVQELFSESLDEAYLTLWSSVGKKDSSF